MELTKGSGGSHRRMTTAVRCRRDCKELNGRRIVKVAHDDKESSMMMRNHPSDDEELREQSGVPQVERSGAVTVRTCLRRSGPLRHLLPKRVRPRRGPEPKTEILYGVVV